MLTKTILFALAISLLMVSCKETDPLGDTPFGDGTTETGIDFASVGNGDFESIEITEGSMTQEFDILGINFEQINQGEHCENGELRKGRKNAEMSKQGKGRRHGKRHHKGHQLRKFLKSLELDESQMEDVHSYMKEFRECAKPNVISMKELFKTYKTSANTARKEVIAQVKAEEITRDEAKVLFKEIRVNVREQIKADPSREELIEAIKDCRKSAFEKIKALLSDEQIIEFEKWLASHKK